MPPEISLTKPSSDVLRDKVSARRPAYVIGDVVLMSATLPKRPAMVEDLGVAPMPPAFPTGVPVRMSESAQRAIYARSDNDLAPMPPDLPHLADAKSKKAF